MKSRLKIAALLLIFLTCIFSTRVIATASPVNSSGITIDGDFSDWNGKPEVSDPKHDIKSPWLDFLNVKYIADDKYLYLYVERLAAEKSQPWHFNVIILNGANGNKYEQAMPWRDTPIYAPQFDIITDYESSRNSNGAVVTVSFDGQNVESTFSASNNAKEIEFRIPLEKVGLDGLNKEIEFTLKSDKDEKTGDYDWVPDGRSITVTTGPTFWQLSSIFFFIVVSFIAYRIYRKKKELNSQL